MPLSSAQPELLNIGHKAPFTQSLHLSSSPDLVVGCGSSSPAQCKLRTEQTSVTCVGRSCGGRIQPSPQPSPKVALWARTCQLKPSKMKEEDFGKQLGKMKAKPSGGAFRPPKGSTSWHAWYFAGSIFAGSVFAAKLIGRKASLS